MTQTTPGAPLPTADVVEVDLDRVRAHLARVEASRTPAAMWPCCEDARDLVGEVDRLTRRLAVATIALDSSRDREERARTAAALAAVDHARLAAAARAAVASGDLAHVTAELGRRELLPPAGARPSSLLAEAEVRP